MTEWLFVAPELEGHPSGGTRYNKALLAALRALGKHVTRSPPEDLQQHVVPGATHWVLVDSLYLDRVAEISARARELRVNRCALLLHYLPSLVEAPSERLKPLAGGEAAALAASDAVIVTSYYMQSELTRRGGYSAEHSAVIEPGCELRSSASVPELRGVNALLVAHLVPGKDVYELLSAITQSFTLEVSFRLDIAGSFDADPLYATRCRELVGTEPALRERVTFLGVLDERRLADEYARHNLCISSSRMEAYGMALAEARTMGLPIIARRGGNVEQHVETRAGGELCDDVQQVAWACARLASDPREHEKRLRRAREHAYTPRPWVSAGNELVSALERIAHTYE